MRIPPAFSITLFYLCDCFSEGDPIRISQVEGNEEIPSHRQVEYSAEEHLPNGVQQSWVREIGMPGLHCAWHLLARFVVVGKCSECLVRTLHLR